MVHCHELTQNWQCLLQQRPKNFPLLDEIHSLKVQYSLTALFDCYPKRQDHLAWKPSRIVSLITMWNMIERRWFFLNTQQAKSDQVHNRENAKLYINISTSQINGFYHEVPQHIRSAFVLFLDMMYSSISLWGKFPRQKYRSYLSS